MARYTVVCEINLYHWSNKRDAIRHARDLALNYGCRAYVTDNRTEETIAEYNYDCEKKIAFLKRSFNLPLTKGARYDYYKNIAYRNANVRRPAGYYRRLPRFARLRVRRVAICERATI